MSGNTSMIGPMIWVALIAGLSVGGSYIYACAAPLAAVAALAAGKMDRRSGLSLVGLAWLSNQTVGYGLLNYPVTVNSISWGVAIGIATAVAFFVATGASKSRQGLVSVGLAFATAFVAYELSLYVASFVLGASAAAFSAATVLLILKINAVALLLLLVLHWAATWLAGRYAAVRYLMPEVAAR